MNNCPFCGAINSIANITPPPGTNAFMLMGTNTNGDFQLPPSGIYVSVKGCNRCGSIFMGSSAIIGAPIENGSLKL